MNTPPVAGFTFQDVREGRVTVNVAEAFKVKISASQISQYRRCQRMWFLQSLQRLPVPFKDGTTFGTVIHSVLERYLRANDLGVDPKTGEPVDMYPPGWMTEVDEHTGRSDTISQDEAGRVKLLVAAAIEQGIVVRTPGRRIEEKFLMPLAHVTSDVGKLYIEITGVIDVETPDGIEDHKSTKKVRYAKSPKALKIDTQMLIYAYVYLKRLRETGAAIPNTIQLKHNVFIKDPYDLRVKEVKATVTPQEVEAHWNLVRDTGIAMARLAKRAAERKYEWHDFPDPMDVAKTCNEFGGCPYMPICHQGQTVEAYVRGVTEVGRPWQVVPSPATSKTHHGGTQMPGVFSKPPVNPNGQQPPAGGAPPAQAFTMPPAINPPNPNAQPQGPQAAVQTAPWFNPACPACPTRPVRGVTATGSECRMCGLKNNQDAQAQRQHVMASWFEIAQDATTGNVMYFCKPEYVPYLPEGCPSEGELVLAGATTQTVEARQPPAPPAPQTVQELPACPGMSPSTRPSTMTVEEWNNRVQQAHAQAAARPAPVAAAPFIPPQSAAPAAQAQPDAAPADAPAAGGKKEKPKGRPEKGFCLLINCAMVKGPKEAPKSLDLVFNEVTTAIATENNVASYYFLDPFKRREALAARVGVIAEQLGTDTFLAATGSTDMREFVQALRCHPRCTEVICGLGGA